MYKVLGNVNNVMFPEPLEIYHNKTAGASSFMVLQDILPVHSEGRTNGFP
jgi:hypothetical protein